MLDVRVIPGEEVTVRVRGEVDFSNAGQLRAALEQAVGTSCKQVVVDMSEVTYIDTIGVQAILRAYQGAQRTGGALTVIAERAAVRDTLRIMNLHDLPGITVRDSTDNAIENIGDGTDDP